MLTPQFFLNFSLATLVFTIYTFFSLLAFNINISSSSSSRGVGENDIDPQEVVVMALCVQFHFSHSRFLC
jgi:hypothetical protein